MSKIVREIYYFEKAGEQNTDDVVEIVGKRISEGDVKYVIVASTSGTTALKFAVKLHGKAQVVCVSEPPYRREWNRPWPGISDARKAELEKLGVIIIDNAHYVFHGTFLGEARWSIPTTETIIRETLYSFGQGLKVAVEVVFLAVLSGRIEPYQDVIGVGGSGKGADTAAVIRASYPGFMFGKDSKKKLEIREILAMPRVKEWWD